MSIIDLRLLEARAAYPNGFDAQHLREQQYGYINVAKRSNLLSMAAMDTINNSWGRTAVRIPVMSQNKPTVTAGSMDCTFVDQDAVATYYDVTFIDGWVPIDMIPQEIDGNELTYEQVFARKLRDAELAIADTIDAAIFGALDTAKATTYNSSLVPTDYPLALDRLQVTAALRPRFFNDMKAIMIADDFNPAPLEVIGNPAIAGDVSFYGNQGGANDTNTQFQFDGYNFSFSRSTTVTAAARGTGFVMPVDSIAYTSRVSGDAKRRSESTTGTQWGTMMSDLLGIELEVMYKSDCADVAARTGNAKDTAALKEQWKVYYNVAILTPYVGAAETNNGIKSFDFLT
jgi:hypothetical protein